MNFNFDAFLLMFNLSQIKDKNLIIKLFLESINDYWKDLDFTYINNNNENNDNEIIISAQGYNFGKIQCNDNFKKINGKEISLINNMISLLAIFLLNREHENMLKDEKDMLEENVKSRTQELENKNEELINKNMEINNLMSEMRNFLYIVSHDLKSPLANIQGFTNEIYDSLKPLKDIDKNTSIENIKKIISSDIFECFDLLKISIDKMNNLLGGLLKISRINTVDIIVKQINMNKLMKEVVDNFKFLISKFNIQIIIDDLPDCLGDKFQIEELFTNLIDNAIKYKNEKKDLIITISGNNEKNFSVYFVKDNGIGIDEKYLKKIFDIFFRINNNNSKGEGLGLTIIKRILERNKGKIQVESKKDQGSTFIVKLPAV